MNAARRIAKLLVPVVALALLVPAAAHAGEAETKLEALVNSMPDADREPDGKYTGPPPEVARKAVLQVLDGGEESILALAAMLDDPFKSQDDYKAHYLLHAVATHVRRPDAEDERRQFCEALTAALKKNRPKLVKADLLEELKWVGGDESVEAIGQFVTDPELYDYAAQALVNIGAPDPLREALPKAKGRVRTALIQGLGTLRDERAVVHILPDVSDPDRDRRLVAMKALANIGDAAAVEPMLKATDAEPAYERAKIVEALLDLAVRLTEAGETESAARICRHLLETARDTEAHFSCAALITLARAVGAEAMDDVLAAMESDQPDIRAAAVQAAIVMPGAEATQRWVARMKKAKPAGRAAILDLLARRGDSAALPAILDAVDDPNPEVRLAALKAALPTGDQRAVPVLTGILDSEEARERQAAHQTLVGIEGEAVGQAVADQLPKVGADRRAELLDILAARGAADQLDVVLRYAESENAKVAAAAASALGTLASTDDLPKLARRLVTAEEGRVRSAAEKALAAACERLGNKDSCARPVAAAMQGADEQARLALVRVLGGIGSGAAFQAVKDALDDPSEEVVTQAIRALADWPDARPADTLLEQARTGKTDTQKVLALRGYIRMIGLREKASVDQRLAMCRQAMEAATRDDERRQVLSAVADIPDPKALAFAQEYLDNQALRNEAASAVIRIATAISGTDRDTAKAAIEQAAEATDAKSVQQQANEALNHIERFEDFIITWKLAGPYRGGDRFSKPYPPEKPDAKVKWKTVSATGDPPGVVDLNRQLRGGSNVAGYMKAQIHAPEALEAQLQIGTDDGVKVWLNGEVVHAKNVPRSLKINEDKVKVQLKEGWNELLMKVTQGGGDWAGCCRVRAADGSKLDGLRYKAE
ncbi:MAG: HEAT repeat domain-containing protein [Planctomycetota bacterium]